MPTSHAESWQNPCPENPSIDETELSGWVIRVTAVEPRGDAEGVELGLPDAAVGVCHESQPWCWGGVSFNERPKAGSRVAFANRGTEPVTNRLEGGPRMVELGGCNGRSRRGLRFVPSRRRLKVMGEVHGPAGAKMRSLWLLTGTLMAERWRIIGSARAS